MPKIVAVVNQKGGVGKTTIATNTASQLHSTGQKVILVDLDPQGSSTDWADAREGEDIFPVIRMGKSIARDLPKVCRDYDWVIIDGAPQVSELAAAAIRAADLVLIPVQPSPYDVWACADIVELIKTRQEVTDGEPKAAFIISRAIKGTNLSREVSEVLDGYGLPVLQNRTTQRVQYAETAKTGGSVLDLDNDHQARFEIRMIAKELEKVMELESA